jgi:hypothetical protein
MRYDISAPLVIRVQLMADGHWAVREGDFPLPLALFDSEQAALGYARDITKTKCGSVIALSR